VTFASMLSEPLLRHPKYDHISKSADAIEEFHTWYVLWKEWEFTHSSKNLKTQI